MEGYTTVVSRVDPKNINKEEYGFNANFFVNNDEDSLSLPNTATEKRRGRPPKPRDEYGEIIRDVDDNNVEKTPLNSNMSYQKTYEDTTSMLSQTIGELDVISKQLQTDLTVIRGSKTLKNKYNYICELSGAMTGLMGSKIQAIREINNTITNCHRFDLQKTKELKLNEVESDDKRIADLYNAWINIPTGSIPGMNNQMSPMQINGPSNGTLGMIGVDVDDNMQVMSGDGGYNNYIQNMTPEQRSMTLEGNPNIKEVVVYNQETQEKFFDVIDMTTGQSVPGVSRPADFVLKEMRVDVRTGMARNASLGMAYPVVFVGNRAYDEY